MKNIYLALIESDSIIYAYHGDSLSISGIPPIILYNVFATNLDFFFNCDCPTGLRLADKNYYYRIKINNVKALASCILIIIIAVIDNVIVGGNQYH